MIKITDEGFEPKELSVPAGTEVIWRNEMSVEASVDSVHWPVIWILPLKLRSHKFEKPGTYYYYNRLKPWHRGVVEVT